MKRLWCAAVILLLAVGMAGGCGTTLESETSVVYVDKKGTVVSLDVEELGHAYYDETELEEFVKEAVDAYTAEHGKGTVTLDKITVEDGTARMQMTYKTAADYAGFNGIELYQERVVTSLADGYAYDGDFAKVEAGKVTGAATKQEIYGEEDLKVVIIRANTDVKIEGEIRYVSCENVKLTGTDTVSIREGYYLDNGTGNAAGDADNSLYGSGTESVGGTEYPAEGSVGATEYGDGISGYGMSTEDGAKQQDMTSGSGAAAEDDGSFETEVYTFIIYK